MRLSLLVLLFLSMGGLARGQDPEPASEPRWFAYQRELSIETLVHACSQAIGIPMEYEPGAIEGSVTISSGPGLTTPELWALTNRHLVEHGLACVQGPEESTLSVVPLDDASARARIEPGAPEEAQAGYVRVLRDLSRAEAGAVADALTSVLAGEGSLVTAIPATEQVLLAGLKPQVIEALRVVDSLDALEVDAVVESVRVEHVSPTALAALVDRVQKAREKAGEDAPVGSLLANPNTQSVIVVAPRGEVETWRGLVALFDEAETLETQHYAPRRFSLDETSKLITESVFRREEAQGPVPARVVQDELTGTLIVTATWSQHEEIDELLERLERTPPESRRTLRSFPVKHRDVEVMLDLLRDLLDEGALFDRSPALGPEPLPEGVGGPIPAEAVARVGPVRSDDLGVTLTQDLGTNRIVAVGPPRLLDQVETLVEQLDVQGPQVLVEALIVTLSEGQTHDLGVEIQKTFRSGDVIGRLQSLFGLGSPDPGDTTVAPVAGTGFTSVVLDPGDFSGVIRALQTVNDGRTLTIPKVLVNNNEQANLDSTLQAPYTTTSLSTSTTITSFGGTLDAGTSVAVRPHITEADKLLLEYTVSLSTFTAEPADPALPPPRQETSLESTATVPDGYAVVIGGLDMQVETEAESRIPWLGEIPLLGFLFKSRSESTSRSRFFVFLRCSVLRSPMFEDLKWAGREDLDQAEIDSGVPEVRPLVMR